MLESIEKALVGSWRPTLSGVQKPMSGEIDSQSNLQRPPNSDRWSLIRDIAAERAARRDEDDFRRSPCDQSDAENDETNDEETIESRVTRIKARVAELTSKIEEQTVPAGGPV